MVQIWWCALIGAPSLPSQQIQRQQEDLEEQLQEVCAQRDHALLQLASAQEEAEHSTKALHNLQAVLEQFQRGTRRITYDLIQQS